MNAKKERILVALVIAAALLGRPSRETSKPKRRNGLPSLQTSCPPIIPIIGPGSISPRR